MAEQLAPVKINAAFIVKDEWPLLALSVSHALFHYAEKVIIIDTGSHDGTFQGIKTLQEIWPNRIHLFGMETVIFDQVPISNLLLEISASVGADWSILLDADEFLAVTNREIFIENLLHHNEQFSVFAINVLNYIVDESHEDTDLEAFQRIKFLISGENAYSTNNSEYAQQVQRGEKPVQYRKTADKLICKNTDDLFVSLGAHQIVFGDGKDWVQHDSRVASGAILGVKIFHLPHTSAARLQRRLDRKFFDNQKTFSRLNLDEFNELDFLALRKSSTLNSSNMEKWIDSGVVINNDDFSKEILPIVEILRDHWNELAGATYSQEITNLFSAGIELQIVISILRKYHSKAENLWNRTIT